MLLSIGAMAAEGKDVSDPKKECVALPYEAVENYLAMPNVKQTISVAGQSIDYYWGQNFTVVADESGYYVITFNSDYSEVFVNNTKITVLSSPASQTSLPSALYAARGWLTFQDEEHHYNVGGLPLSVAGSLIGSAIGAYFGLHVGHPVVTTIIGNVLGSLIGMFLDGQFPADYYLTTLHQKYFQIIDPDIPTTLWWEILGIYGGPRSDYYETTLYYVDRTYETH